MKIGTCELSMQFSHKRFIENRETARNVYINACNRHGEIRHVLVVVRVLKLGVQVYRRRQYKIGRLDIDLGTLRNLVQWSYRQLNLDLLNLVGVPGTKFTTRTAVDPRYQIYYSYSCLHATRTQVQLQPDSTKLIVIS